MEHRQKGLIRQVRRRQRQLSAYRSHCRLVVTVIVLREDKHHALLDFTQACLNIQPDVDSNSTLDCSHYGALEDHRDDSFC